MWTEFSAHQLDVVRRLRDSPTTNFVELVQLAGLNPAHDFRQLDMSRADFFGCRLRGFDFTGSILAGARFRGSRIEGAIFDDEQRHLAELVGALDFGRIHTILSAEILLRPANLGQRLIDAAIADDLATIRDCVAAGADLDQEVEIGVSTRTALTNTAQMSGPLYGGKVGTTGAEFLLRAGADVNHAVGPEGWTPLLAAAYDGSVGLVRLFLRYGADPNSAATDGRTPLFGAVRSGSREVVKMLLDAGGNPHVSARDFGTLVEFAKSVGDRSIAKLVRDHVRRAVT